MGAAGGRALAAHCRALAAAAGRPLAELSLVVTGDVVLVFHGRRAFDALTGQQWIFAVAELAREVEQLRGQLPRQGELFPRAVQQGARSA